MHGGHAERVRCGEMGARGGRGVGWQGDRKGQCSQANAWRLYRLGVLRVYLFRAHGHLCLNCTSRQVE